MHPLHPHPPGPAVTTAYIMGRIALLTVAGALLTLAGPEPDPTDPETQP